MTRTATKTVAPRKVKAVRLAVPVDLHRELLRIKIDRDAPLYEAIIEVLDAGVKSIRQSRKTSA